METGWVGGDKVTWGSGEAEMKDEGHKGTWGTERDKRQMSKGRGGGGYLDIWVPGVTPRGDRGGGRGPTCVGVDAVVGLDEHEAVGVGFGGGPRCPRGQRDGQARGVEAAGFALGVGGRTGRDTTHTEGDRVRMGTRR